VPDRYEKVEHSLDRLASLMLLSGPITVYQAHRRLQPETKIRKGMRKPSLRDPPLGTVHSHFGILEEEEELVVYRAEKDGRKQKYYGFTPYGFLMTFSIPSGIAKEHFKRAMEIWLREKEFRFFLPKDAVLREIKNGEVELHLANVCQMIADAFPKAKDVADYLRELGYGEFGPSQIVDFAANCAQHMYPKQFLESSRVLCRHFPSYRERIRRYVEDSQSWIDSMKSQLLEGG